MTKSPDETRALLATRAERCADACPGWIICETNTERGDEIQVCDECAHHINKLDVSDADVSQLPEAQEAFALHLDEAQEAEAATPEVSILSIDAWNGPDGWTWNQWWRVGSCPVTVCDLSPRKLLRFLRHEGYLSPQSAGRVAIDDDGYNVVILDKNTLQPLFAIAYGEVL